MIEYSFVRTQMQYFCLNLLQIVETLYDTIRYFKKTGKSCCLETWPEAVYFEELCRGTLYYWRLCLQSSGTALEKKSFMISPLYL